MLMEDFLDLEEIFSPEILWELKPNPDEPEPKGESRSKRDDTAGR